MIEPMVRGGFCLNCDPDGLRRGVEAWAGAVKRRRGRGPLSTLVIGSSTGYGLASRLVAAFGYGAKTVGISVERAETERKQGSPGYYNNRAFDDLARRAGLESVTLEADAFADDAKRAVFEAGRRHGPFDLVVYSVAAPARVDPDTGKEYRSAIKPIGAAYSGKALDYATMALVDTVAEPATAAEIEATVKVMGGEDWERWIRMALEAGALAPGAVTVAYSYIGPAFSHAIYRDGTIGEAKKHLEASAASIARRLAASGGSAYVSVNKALVTRSSAVIPGVSPYMAALFRVMKDKGLHEGCLEQMERLFADRLYAGGKVPVDERGLIRLDDLEMRADVQAEVADILGSLETGGFEKRADLAGIKADFLATNGFGVPTAS